MIISSIPSDIVYFSFAVSLASFGFAGYLYLMSSPFLQKMLKAEKGEVRYILFQRWFGAFFMGVVPIVFALFYSGPDLSRFGIRMPGISTLYWVLALAAIIIPMNLYDTRSASNLRIYPQIRMALWPVPVVVHSGLSWACYLIAYELLFRGFLFFSALAILGLWPAIIITTAFYSLTHLLKGFKETLGAIPLGILVALMTYYTGTVWAAAIVHVILGLSNEWLSLYLHPDMKIR